MKSLTILLALCLMLAAACSFPSRDAELEEAIGQMVQAEEVLAISDSDRVVVNMTGLEPFPQEDDERRQLAQRLAHRAHALRPDPSLVMIGFARAAPDIEQYAYSWEVENGELKPVED